MSAFMVSHKLTVDPNTGTIIYSPEVEENPTLAFGQVKFSLVPAVWMKTRVADAACGGFWSERNFNRMSPIRNVTRLNKLPSVVKCKLPRTVETHPVRALQLWTWICCFDLARISPCSGITGQFITIFQPFSQRVHKYIYLRLYILAYPQESLFNCLHVVDLQNFYSLRNIELWRNIKYGS